MPAFHRTSRIAAAIWAFVLMLGVNMPQVWAEDAPNPAAQAVIDSQIKSFRSGDHDGAFSHASPNLQRMFGSTDSFITMVKRGYGAIYAAKSWAFGPSRNVSGTYYQEVQIVGPQGNSWRALYTMQQQADGSWKITGVQMKRGVAKST
ncbi:MAG: DUF4864 domain-containing protein [Ahrensia sp.]|nr:DUF4864 domain-containing protein [Ahrensia sp.]